MDDIMDMNRILELAGVPLNESKQTQPARLDEATKIAAFMKKLGAKVKAVSEFANSDAADKALGEVTDTKMRKKMETAVFKAVKALDALCAECDKYSEAKIVEEEELDEKMALAGTGKAPKTPTDDPKKKDADASRLPKGDGKDPKLDDDAESPESVASKSKEWQAFLKKSDTKDGGKQPKAPGTK